ncbi:MAG: hypothetical protein C4315_01735 [Chloroflexota bacterium]
MTTLRVQVFDGRGRAVATLSYFDGRLAFAGPDWARKALEMACPEAFDGEGEVTEAEFRLLAAALWEAAARHGYDLRSPPPPEASPVGLLRRLFGRLRHNP